MNRNPQEEIEEIEEAEAAANYVSVPACTVEKVAARPDQRSLCFSQTFLPIAVCWLILLVIMGLRIYFTNRILNDKLSVLENQVTDLTAVNQELETERNNSRGPIQNISRAQWSIDEYCPKLNNERQCRACQKGWTLFKSSCYLINDADPPEEKTWEEAREDCRSRSSDLVVVHDEDELDVLIFNGWSWIGLRAEGGTWKWIDGSDLTESDWIPTPPQPPTDVTNRNLNDKLSVLENQITDLTERNNLRGPRQNISRAQWSIDEYGPKENNGFTQLVLFRKGWILDWPES
ncbi:C-type lectin domain family 17, member A-like [Perca flavescens]|uniref:C-type lectin domain family 17, member A-like n=1 Tax=Perca flavescens TaxID=8167 RepID=UPI00106EDC25|nr:C-type lectin domain family 17, member A-like [Perca flavescens]